MLSPSPLEPWRCLGWLQSPAGSVGRLGPATLLLPSASLGLVQGGLSSPVLPGACSCLGSILGGVNAMLGLGAPAQRSNKAQVKVCLEPMLVLSSPQGAGSWGGGQGAVGAPQGSTVALHGRIKAGLWPQPPGNSERRDQRWEPTVEPPPLLPSWVLVDFPGCCQPQLPGLGVEQGRLAQHSRFGAAGPVHRGGDGCELLTEGLSGIASG